MSRSKRRHLALLPIVAAGAALSGCGETQPIEIKALSNRPDLVSGGDVLLELTLPAGATAAGLEVSVDGRDVTAAFAAHHGRLRGLVEGLAVGNNRVSAVARDAGVGTLIVTNAPRGGPVLSGPQARPFVCATPVPQPAAGNLPATNGSGLHTQAVDAQCNVATEYALYYKTTTPYCAFALPDPSPKVAGFPPELRQAVPFTSTSPPQTATAPANGCFKPYDPGAAAPADLAMTTTDAGVTVPFIVRVERGVLNRGIYDIAVLYDPTRPWTALEPQPQWNGKVLFQFGFGNGQPRRQLRPVIAWTDSGIGIGPNLALERGYLVAANSMTDSISNSNRVLMAETLMMMKEHVVERYGEIRFTVGAGGSGGAATASLGASIAPGLLDGIVIGATLPDGETLLMVPDCALLVAAYQQPGWLDLLAAGGYTVEQINAKKAAINGHADQTACHSYFGMFAATPPGNYQPRGTNAAGEITALPASTNNCELPASVVYDAKDNPSGVRCDEAAWAASIWGSVPGTTFNNITRDNVGVQYGLAALRSGAITPEEFVTLNELVGGFDRDNNPTPARSGADEAALVTAYRAGIVASGHNLAKVAVLDLRGWDDARGGIHHIALSYALRDRLDRETGRHESYVMWRFGPSPPPFPPFFPSLSMQRDALLAMDSWLTRLEAHDGDASLEEKVRAARPTDVAFDYCVLSSDTTRSIKVTDATQCDADPLLRPAASPRQVAGGPRAENVLKCQREALTAADYGPVTFDEAQWARLEAVFPTGVCDWTKPGVGQQAAVSPLTFALSPGGQQLRAD